MNTIFKNLTVLVILVAVCVSAWAQQGDSETAGLSADSPSNGIQHYPVPGSDGSLPFSDAVIVGDLVFTAGKLGIPPGTRSLVDGGIGPETRQTLENIKASLERVGSSMDRVAKCTVFLADMAEWPAMNEVYRTFFSNPPARSAVAVSGLALDARVEIECIAAAGNG